MRRAMRGKRKSDGGRIGVVRGVKWWRDKWRGYRGGEMREEESEGGQECSRQERGE